MRCPLPACVLISPQIKPNSQLSGCACFLSRHAYRVGITVLEHRVDEKPQSSLSGVGTGGRIPPLSWRPRRVSFSTTCILPLPPCPRCENTCFNGLSVRLGGSREALPSPLNYSGQILTWEETDFVALLSPQSSCLAAERLLPTPELQWPRSGQSGGAEPCLPGCRLAKHRVCLSVDLLWGLFLPFSCEFPLCESVFHTKSDSVCVLLPGRERSGRHVESTDAGTVHRFGIKPCSACRRP